MDRARSVWLGVFPSHKEIRGHLGHAIIDPREAILGQIGLPGHDIQPDVVGLEKGPHFVEIFLLDRIKFVVVTLGAVHREAKEALAHVLNSLVHPRGAVKRKIIADEVACGAEFCGVVGIDLVGGEHLANHFVVGRIGVQGFNDPISPVPHVLLTIAHFLTQPPPIAESPDVHPVAGPPHSVLWIGQKLVDQLCVPVGRLIRLKQCELSCCGGQTDKIQIEPPDKHTPLGLGLRREPVVLVAIGQEGIDGIFYPRRSGYRRHCGTSSWLKGPVISRVSLGLFVGGGRSPGHDPILEKRDLLRRERLAFALGRHMRGRIWVAHSRQDQACAGVFLRDDRAGFTSLKHEFDGVQSQTSLLLEPAVAGKASRRQERLELFPVDAAMGLGLRGRICRCYRCNGE